MSTNTATASSLDSCVESLAASFRRVFRPYDLPIRSDWYGLRSHDRAQPLSDVGCRALAFHLATTTLKSR